jgi:hypothetical protein
MNQIAVLKYQGGGDWYANLQTSLPNLIAFSNKSLGTNLNNEQAIVEIGSQELFNYPFVHMTGHGNVVFSNAEAGNMRTYLISGGFLHIDDNYGMDPFVRVAMKKVFPELDWLPIPINHPIFHGTFDFPQGLPKIHAHDSKSPEALGLFWEGQLICLYTYEADLGDGWEDPQVHNDTPENHEAALKMGCNIIEFVFLGKENEKAN